GKKIMENMVDIALAPVAVLQHLHDAHVITDYCIGATGNVHSVCLFSEVPIEQISAVYLDDHSLTSVSLLKILLKEYWQLSPELIPAKPGYIDQIRHDKAGLVIGDRSFVLHHKFEYCYDLSAAWKEHTGLSFVFAAWMRRKEIPADLIFELNEALKYGIMHLDAVVAEQKTSIISKEELVEYFQHNISYDLDDEKRKALQLFLEKMRSLHPVNLHI
ncbi:MAG: menaquinone biosynthesis protein, partial [Chitinophagales bacterium]|nr:menaquinone biosynthesis protein [Chitinophagales bacterium]